MHSANAEIPTPWSLAGVVRIDGGGLYGQLVILNGLRQRHQPLQLCLPPQPLSYQSLEVSQLHGGCCHAQRQC